MMTFAIIESLVPCTFGAPYHHAHEMSEYGYFGEDLFPRILSANSQDLRRKRANHYNPLCSKLVS
jgi:hypothetical protein